MSHSWYQSLCSQLTGSSVTNPILSCHDNCLPNYLLSYSRDENYEFIETFSDTQHTEKFTSVTLVFDVDMWAVKLVDRWGSFNSDYLQHSDVVESVTVGFNNTDVSVTHCHERPRLRVESSRTLLLIQCHREDLVDDVLCRQNGMWSRWFTCCKHYVFAAS